MVIFNTQNGATVREITFENPASGMMHPLTYLNKLVHWGGNKMWLHNVMEDQVIFQFPDLESDILIVVQSPVVNVVAVGCKNGAVKLVNLLYAEVLFTFQNTDGGVSQITFLTDTTLGQSLMATSSEDSGAITLWDLNAKKIWC